jgi:hypothetical protein
MAHARLRKKGVPTGTPNPEEDRKREEALEVAAAMVRTLAPNIAPQARQIADWVLTAYILKRAEQAFTDPEIMRAITSERPWDMVKLIDKDRVEEAALTSALPVVGELVGQIDPTGQKPFFAYTKEEVLRLFEAVVWCWEEAKANRPRLSAIPDDEIPF